uniref:Ig-like domain-containing protein n=1 Tax=Oryzias latipes TaxID=8090 RepID=A0A3P9MPN1_ORYLA
DIEVLTFLLFPGENRLIGSDNPIIVAPGQDVILPCRLELEMDLLHKTIEWSKEGSKTEPARRRSWKTYVFLYRRGIQISAMMMQLYIQRTSLFDERLRHGDVSLKIMNVTLDDSGTYECFLPERDQRAKVQLVVSKFGIQFSSVSVSIHPSGPWSRTRNLSWTHLLRWSRFVFNQTELQSSLRFLSLNTIRSRTTEPKRQP